MRGRIGVEYWAGYGRIQPEEERGDIAPMMVKTVRLTGGRWLGPYSMYVSRRIGLSYLRDDEM